MPTELSIIIVNWNGLGFLPDCLKSIAENPPSVPYEVIVVDNASSDGSIEWLESEEPVNLFPPGAYRFIETGENLGFGKANNLAFVKTNSDFLLLLNPDTRVGEESIDKLLNCVKKFEDVGIAGPRLVNEDGSLQISVWSSPQTATKVVFEGFKLYRLLPRSIRSNWLLGKHWLHDEERFVPSLSGAVMLLRRSMLNKLGGFADDIHMYGEDAELCDRLARSSWKMVFVPDSIVVHIGGKSSSQRWDSADRTTVIEQAYVNFLLRTLPSRKVLTIAVAKIFVAATQILFRSLLGREILELKQLLRVQISTIAKLLPPYQRGH